MPDEETNVDATNDEETNETKKTNEGDTTTDSGAVDQWDLTEQFRNELRASNRREALQKSELDEANTKLEQLQQELTTAKANPPPPATPDGDNVDDDEKRLSGEIEVLRESIRQSNELNKQTRKENELLRQKFDVIDDRTREAEALRMLESEVKANEKALGTQEHTNKVVKDVNVEFVDQEVFAMPPKARQAWIKNTLKLRFMEAAEQSKSNKTGKTNTGTSVTTNDNEETQLDTGTGDTNASDDIPEGDFKTVTAAIDARNKRLGI